MEAASLAQQEKLDLRVPQYLSSQSFASTTNSYRKGLSGACVPNESR